MKREEGLQLTAEYYIKSGLSIIPVGKNKKPLIDWKEYQDRKASLKEFKKWLQEYPNLQIGIVTGRISGIIVVDIEAGGDISWLPKTAVARTGGGGYHFYYSYVNGVKNSTRIKHLTDIRGDGGYVIAPPSSSDKGEYKWDVKMKPVPFPKNLFQKPEITTYTKVESDYSGYSTGQRNNEMARYIGHLLAKIHPSEWRNIGLKMATDANTKNNPPLSESELLSIFYSIENIERRNNADRWYRKNEEDVPTNIWKEADNNVMLMKDIASKAEYQQGDKYELGISVFDNAIGGGVEDGDLVVISGLSGFGKTLFSQTLAVNLAEQGLPVLFFSYEVLIHHLWNKFKAMGIREDLIIYSVERHTTGNVGWIEEKIKEAKERFMTKIIVIDHLGFLVPKSNLSDISKNYSAYVGQIVRDLKTVAKNEEVVIILPVHLRKTNEPDINDLKDSSSISQESDLVFILNREKNPNANEGNVYLDHTKIMLVKNRKTGITAQGWFKVVDGKLQRDPFFAPPEKTRINY